MKRLVTLGFLALVFATCTPSIDTTNPPQFVTARLDLTTTPPIVPLPTDLAKDPTTGKLKIPLSPSASPAEVEFATGFLNTLAGFPPDTSATATFDGALDATTVNRSTVLILDQGAGRPVTNAPISYADLQITIAPPTVASDGGSTSSGWAPGHQYAIALVGGSGGLKGAQGQTVVGSSVWTLLSLSNPLVICDPGCRATTDLIPSDQHDPAARIADQAQKAAQLEPIRLGYNRVLNAFAGQGIPRANIVLMWTFTILDQAQATFDPAESVIPFPNNLVTLPLPDGGRRVDLPIPDGGSDLQRALYTGLNMLDGFSTTTPIISENADNLGALTFGTLDPASLTAATGVINVSGGAQPQILACLDCTSSLLPDGGIPNNPQTLELVPRVPLNERTNYVAFFTTGLKDTQGKNVAPTAKFALLRNRYPLVDADGKSTISAVPTSPDLQRLERARAAMKPAFDALERAGHPREELVLATAFTTQSEETALKQLKAVANTATNLPIFVYNDPPGSRIYQGAIITAYVLTGPGGVADPLNPQPQKILFTMIVPSAAPPPNGYPITIFGHGLTRARGDFLAIVSLVSNGQAVIATDAPFHGDRSSCTGSAAYLQSIGICTNCTDDDACDVPANERCNPSTGRCIARVPASRASCDPGVTGGVPGDVYCSVPSRRQGFCLNESGVLVCEGGDFLRDSTNTPVISGWNILNLTNFFATRDNFRQQVIDLAQLTRVIQVPTSTPNSFNALLNPPGIIDSNTINYIGQSLGGILGTLYTSVAPEVHRVVLNVPGASLPRILLTSPAFARVRAVFLATLAAQNPPILPGSPAFDTFVGVAQWVLDPADPQNQALSLMNGSTLPSDRKVLIQSITRDQVIPNPTTDILIASANRTLPGNRLTDTCRFDPPDSRLPPPDRHGFLLNFVSSVDTNAAQAQAINYVNNIGPFVCPP